MLSSWRRPSSCATATSSWAALRAHLDEAETIELLMLCGQYDALATTPMTIRAQPE